MGGEVRSGDFRKCPERGFAESWLDTRRWSFPRSFALKSPVERIRCSEASRKARFLGIASDRIGWPTNAGLVPTAALLTGPPANARSIGPIGTGLRLERPLQCT